jgi:hypothetical protein
MTGDYWDEAVYAVPPLSALDRIPESTVFGWLELTFPLDGGKIDWRRAEGRHRHWRIDNGRLLAATAVTKICERVRPGSAVEHVGDALSPCAVRFGAAGAELVTAALLEIPEHHYFVAEDRRWVVVVSLEGDLDVLDRPTGDPLSAEVSCPT